MIRRLRPRSLYDVLAALAFFGVVAGGTAYAANTVLSGDIVDGEVKTADLASAAVTNAKLADNSVGKPKISAGAVENGKIADGAVGAVEARQRVDRQREDRRRRCQLGEGPERHADRQRRRRRRSRRSGRQRGAPRRRGNPRHDGTGLRPRRGGRRHDKKQERGRQCDRVESGRGADGRCLLHPARSLDRCRERGSRRGQRLQLELHQRRRRSSRSSRGAAGRSVHRPWTMPALKIVFAA